jgi:hypothetical protein
MKPSDFSSANINSDLPTAIRVIVPWIALAITTAELVYWLGGELRIAIDTRNDQLAAWWVAVLGVAPAPAPAPAPALEPIVTPDPIMIAPAPAPVRKSRTYAKKAAVAAPPAPATPDPKRPRPAKRAPKRALLEVVAA